jgi:hypothetical protein
MRHGRAETAIHVSNGSRAPLRERPVLAAGPTAAFGHAGILGVSMIKDRVLSHRIDAATKTRITMLLGNRYSSTSEFVRGPSMI